jgi:hypothetical protein
MTAQTGDAFGSAQQGFASHTPQKHQYFRLYQRNMPFDKRQAGGNFGFGRGAVAGGAPKQNVRHVNPVTVKTCGAQHLVQKLATGAYKGFALAVFILTGRFANEHDRRGRVAVGKDQIHGGGAQRAALKFAQFFAQRVERLGGDAVGGGWRLEAGDWRLKVRRLIKAHRVKDVMLSLKENKELFHLLHQEKRLP